MKSSLALLLAALLPLQPLRAAPSETFDADSFEESAPPPDDFRPEKKSPAKPAAEAAKAPAKKKIKPLTGGVRKKRPAPKSYDYDEEEEDATAKKDPPAPATAATPPPAKPAPAPKPAAAPAPKKSSVPAKPAAAPMKPSPAPEAKAPEPTETPAPPPPKPEPVAAPPVVEPPAPPPAAVPPLVEKKAPATPKQTAATDDASLRKDLAYYRRFAKERKMGANDRIYLLHRLKDKHAPGKADLAPLLKEIAVWEAAKKAGEAPTSPAAAPPAATALPAAPALLPETPAAAMPVETSTDTAPAPPAVEVAVSPRSDDYRIQPGDLLNVQVTPAKELSRETLIQPDGALVFPLVGTLAVKDMTQDELERTLARKLKSFVSAPQVRVSIRQFSTNSVFVMGKVARPGPVTYRLGMRLLSSVSEAGGFMEDADRNAVKVYRGQGADRKSFTHNAQAVMAAGDITRDFLLQPGDIVDVQRGGNSVSILGMVAKPGVYAYKEGSTLLELVSEAGGPAQGATGNVFVYRQEDGNRDASRVNLGRILKGHPEEDIPLKPGDIIMVPQKGLYAGTGAMNAVLTPWLYLATLIIAIVLATRKG